MADASAKTDTAPQGQQPEAQPPKLKEPQKPRTVKYFVDRKSLLIKATVLLAALSVLFRLIGYWGFWSDPASDATYSQVFLPIVCCLLFMAFIVLLGKSALWVSSIPVFFAAVFFILETFSVTPWWIKALSILLYVVAACVYAMTVFGKIRTKWVLVVTIGTPLVYHLAVQDRTTLLNASTPATLVQWMPELSAMSFLIALLFTALAMDKVPPPPQYDPRLELPQIRALRYVPDELEFKPQKKTGAAPRPQPEAAPAAVPAPAPADAQPAAEAEEPKKEEASENSP